MLLYKEMQLVSPTGPVFVPGVAGERLQAKTVERHVRTQTLLECSCCHTFSADVLLPVHGTDQDERMCRGKHKHECQRQSTVFFVVVFTNYSDGQRITKLVFPHDLLIFDSRNTACNVSTPWSQGG